MNDQRPRAIPQAPALAVAGADGAISLQDAILPHARLE
jgi:hypothetical protein